MDTFIRATEVWVPSRDRQHLEMADGLYGPMQTLGQLRGGLQLPYGEGLAGQAWAKRHPIVLNNLADSNFKFGEAALEQDLNCAVALPLFCGELLTAVLVFLCGSADRHVGAIEVWKNDPAVSHDLALHDGYYGDAELFRHVSQRVLFQVGEGLPGRVWQTGMPALLNDLGQSYRFQRQEEARRVGLDKGFGLPCASVDGSSYVLTLLSASDTPLARRIEVWVPDAARSSLSFASGLCDLDANLAHTHADTRIPRGQTAIGGVWRSGVPAVVLDLATDPSPAARAAQSAGLQSMVAMPIWDGGLLKCAVAWYF